MSPEKNDMNNQNNRPNQKNNAWGNLLYIFIPILLIITIAYYVGGQVQDDKPKYYEIVETFRNGEVSEYSLNLSNGALNYKIKGEEKEFEYVVPNVDIFLNDVHNYITEYNLQNEEKIKYDYKRGSNSATIWASVLPMLLCSLLVVALLFVFYRKMGQNIMNENNHALTFGKARVKLAKDAKKKTTFKDVAGADEEKAELEEIVEFLRAPEAFNAMGARIPKGVLLVGPPGTGKTLLARAVAGEAGVPFFSISGSDFVEMYVGVGASRVRDLFDQAKKNAPSILFIDEIDAVGRHRGAGMGGGHDEREQTLNQLLIEMDGFGVNEGVIILAATNRPDILDPALLRPGRFDRQLTVGYPDIKGREEILKVHARNKPLAPDVKLDVIAKTTVGFTGADLENLLNEAALLATRRKKKSITMEEIKEATVKCTVGTEKKSHKMTDKEKKLTAYHEAGHAVAAFFVDEHDPVQEISIIPRGRAGGYTMYLPSEERENYSSKNEMIGNIVSGLGGRVAEELCIGDVSTGASGDIEHVTKIARSMVTRYGMSKELGPIMFGTGDREVFLGRDYGSVRDYSETVASKIDEEVKAIILGCYDKCRDILTVNNDKLVAIAEYLLVNEKMTGETFVKIMNGESVEETVEETETEMTPEQSAEETVTETQSEEN